jgi:hypothetical protein
MKKLTLSTDARTIARAKRIADERGTSVSALFTDLIQAVPMLNGRTGTKTRKATGLIKLPGGKSDRKLIEDAVRQRHQVQPDVLQPNHVQRTKA